MWALGGTGLGVWGRPFWSGLCLRHIQIRDARPPESPPLYSTTGLQLVPLVKAHGCSPELEMCNNSLKSSWRSWRAQDGQLGILGQEGSRTPGLSATVSQCGRDILPSGTYYFVQVSIRDSGYRAGIGSKSLNRVPVARDW